MQVVEASLKLTVLFCIADFGEEVLQKWLTTCQTLRIEMV